MIYNSLQRVPVRGGYLFPDKRNWSFRNRCLSEAASTSYSEIVKKTKRGDLCFSSAYFSVSQSKVISLRGIPIKQFLIDISIDPDNPTQIEFKMPQELLDRIYGDPTDFVVWQLLKSKSKKLALSRWITNPSFLLVFILSLILLIIVILLNGGGYVGWLN